MFEEDSNACTIYLVSRSGRRGSSALCFPFQYQHRNSGTLSRSLRSLYLCMFSVCIRVRDLAAACKASL